MVKEALDILTIAKSTDNPRQTILKAIAEYAKAKNIPVLGAKVEVLQYLSPEWKKEVDREVRKYLAQNNLFEIVQLPQGDPRRTEYIENLKILNQEGYADYLVFAIHHVDKPKQIEGILIYHERFLANIKKEFEQENKDQSFSEKEKYVFGNSFPEAKKYFEDLKIKSPNDYNYAIKIAWQNLFFAKKIKQTYPNLDCDEITLILQKLVQVNGLQIGDYIQSDGHVSLKLDGFPLVLDMYDSKIRSIIEFGKQVGYKGNYFGSYYLQSKEGYYLAVYSSEENDSPKQILGYKKSMGDNLTLNTNISNLLYDLSYDLFQLIKSFSIPLKIKLYELMLEINPNDANAHYNYALLLNELERNEEAEFHYLSALKINPNDADTHYNYAHLLYNFERYKEAREHLGKYKELIGQKDAYYNYLNDLLKQKNF